MYRDKVFDSIFKRKYFSDIHATFDSSSNLGYEDGIRNPDRKYRLQSTFYFLSLFVF